MSYERSPGRSPDRYADHQADPDAVREAGARLSLVHGPVELRAALLALLVVPDSHRSQRAWQIETVETPSVGPLLAHVRALTGATRLPWFDRLLERMARHSIEKRRELLQATRRVMGARGVVRPLDRLHWLAMRKGLGEATSQSVRTDASAEVTEWLETDVVALETYSAFLARMVPLEVRDGREVGPEGIAWYGQVIANWVPGDVQTPEPHVDSEKMATALHRLQTLSWMQRPIILRSWVQAAQKATVGRLADGSADALRLTCQLLDSPLPPELARHYVELPPEPAPG